MTTIIIFLLSKILSNRRKKNKSKASGSQSLILQFASIYIIRSIEGSYEMSYITVLSIGILHPYILLDLMRGAMKCHI